MLFSQDSVRVGKGSIPRSECPYEAADTCTGFQPKTCCERVNGGNTTTPGDDFTDNGINTMYSSFLIALWLLVFHLKLQ